MQESINTFALYHEYDGGIKHIQTELNVEEFSNIAAHITFKMEEFDNLVSFGAEVIAPLMQRFYDFKITTDTKDVNTESIAHIDLYSIREERCGTCNELNEKYHNKELNQEIARIFYSKNMNSVQYMFCNDDQFAFGSEDSGICGIAKLYKDEKEFLEDYRDKIDDSSGLDEDDVTPISIYFNPEAISDKDDGLRMDYKPHGSNKSQDVNNRIALGTFYGIEY